MIRSRAQRLSNAARQHRDDLIAARDYTRLLRLALNRLFPASHDRAVATRLLEQYGSGPDEPQPERVRLAILKLCGEDMSTLPEHIAGAKEDYEDTLWWAESPRRTRLAMSNTRLSDAEADKIAREDGQEYEHWIETHTEVV